MTGTRELHAIAKKNLALREQFWPEAEPQIWNRKTHHGFTTIPKTMPLIMKAQDEMTKGTPVSSTYLTLWCSTWDFSFVNITKPSRMADAAGFSGKRGEQTWIARMKRLHELKFIDIKPGSSGPLSHALIFNPHTVIRWHWQNKTPGLVESTYNALTEWALDIGAKDMTTPEPDKSAGL